jgi:NADH-quinone oxidoreductase subunit M
MIWTDYILFLNIAVPVGVGLISLLFFSWAKKVQWILFALTVAVQAFFAITMFGAQAHTETISLPITVMNLNQLELTVRNGGLGMLFFLMTAIVTVVISLFSLSYNDKAHATGIAPLWTMLMGANAGIFFSADWVTFLLAWELMGWTSFFIISHGRECSGKAGMYYYAQSLVGTAALLAFVFIGVANTGSFAVKNTIAFYAGQWASNPGLVTVAAILLVLTFFTKSAVFPFFMWPSKAHAEAPDDFSAFLSGVMIKYGVFGMIVFLLPLFAAYNGPMVFDSPVFLFVLGCIGMFTALWGTLHAIRENDMKRLMAHSTVSNIGFILTALSINTALGIAAAVFHTFNHMVFKSSIFLSMGSVKYRTGERDMHKLGGMAYRMPLSFFVFLLGIISAAGIPPMSGFASKWMVFQAMFEKQWLLPAIVGFFASTAAFLYLYRGLHSIYLGQLSPRFKDVKEAPFLQAAAQGILMLGVFAVGLFPGLVLIPVNNTLAELGMKPLALDLFNITGVTSSLNITSIGLAFIGVFALVFVLFLIGKKRRYVGMMDTYTSGETPSDWGVNEDKLHYAYNFYEPIEKFFEPFLNGFSMDKLFTRIAHEAKRLSNAVQKWFNSPQAGIILLGVLAVLALALGRLL